MSADATECPQPDALEEALLRPPGPPGVLEHLARCERCGQLAELLRADNALLAEVAHAAGAGARRSPPGGGPTGGRGAAPAGEVPGFEIIGEIHRGGQGVVLDAIQRSTQRRVALKKLLRGAFATNDERRRFEREIAIVAGLRHPGIVTLYESGVAEDGAGWFAMEYVEGLTLDQHLMATRPSRRERVRLLLAIAEAVSCAHQRGVIHRDLKPSNIVVTPEGEPRVLDFGLARPVELDGGPGVTLDGRFVGTLSYAAPEQLAADDHIDVRADIYAIGLMLYEALTGARPIDGAVSLEAFLRARRDPVPMPPLKAAGADGDLRAIVATATAPEPSRRYQSSAALAEDLRRWLEGRPVAARADSLGYLVGRLARRHWVAVGAAGVVVLLIAASAILSSALLVRVERQRALAERTLTAFTGALLAADPLSTDAAGTSVVDFLGGAGRRIEDSLAEDPEAAVRVRSTLGGIALNLAELDRAERDFAFVLEQSRRLFGPRSIEVARALHDMGRVTYRRGDFATAAGYYEQALELRRSRLGPVQSDVATSASHLAACRRRLGQLEASEALYREALSIREALAWRQPEAVAESQVSLGLFLLDIGRVDEAVPMLEHALEIITALAGPDDWRTGRTQTHLATALLERGEIERARALLEAAAAVWQDRVSMDHPFSAAVLLQQCRCALLEGDLQRARTLCDAALQARLTHAPSHHPDVQEASMWSAVVLRELGDHAQSEAILRGLLDQRPTTTVSGPLLRLEIELASTLAAAGRVEEAAALLENVRVRMSGEQANPLLAQLAAHRLALLRGSR